LDDRGYIKRDNFLATDIPGVYVAGEAGDPDFRQVVTSAGMGAAAAMQAIRFLQEHEEKQPASIKA
jgi:thioredoxin reductase (NADPH)